MSSAPKPEVTPEILDRVAREVARIRERSGSPVGRSETAMPKLPVGRTHNALLVEAEQLRRISSNPDTQIGRMPPQPPTLRGRVGAVLVRGVRRALFWYTQQINEILGRMADVLFHYAQSVGEAEKKSANNAQKLQELSDAVAGLTRDVEALAAQDNRLEQLTETIAAIARDVETLRFVAGNIDSVSAAVDCARRDVENLRSGVDRHERIWAEFAERLRKAEMHNDNLRAELAVERSRVSLLMQQRHQGASDSPTVAPDPGAEPGPLYLQFENAFRGSRAEIKARAVEYLPLLREKNVGSPHMPVLDLGCGRGEWMEVLAENGFTASGVDSNAAFVDECRIRGFVVHHGDAIRFLQESLPEIQGAITAFHVIEHLPFPALLSLLDEAVRVLKPGGILMLETPNPANLLVGAHTFYLDPTHIRPLPADLIRFVVESRGFCDVRIMPLHPFPECYRLDQDNRVAEVLNQVLYGPRDYLIVAQRP